MVSLKRYERLGILNFLIVLWCHWFFFFEQPTIN